MNGAFQFFVFTITILITPCSALGKLRIKKNESICYTLNITKDTVAPYKKTVNTFVQTRRSQFDWLNAPIISTIVSLLSPAISCFAGVDIDEARAFLNRAFEDENKLHEAIARFDKNEKNLKYLNDVLSSVDSTAIAQKSTDSLPTIMKKHRHPDIPQSVKPWDKAQVCDDLFYEFCACNFIAFHIIESEGPARIAKKENDKNPEFIEPLAIK